MSEYALTEKQMVALEALLQGKSQSEASKLAGVNRSTTHEWLHTSEKFKAALEEAQRLNLERTIRKFRHVAPEAAEVVEGILKGEIKGKEAFIRLRAAEIILDRVGIGAAAMAVQEKPRNAAEAARQVAQIYGLGDTEKEPEPVDTAAA